MLKLRDIMTTNLAVATRDTTLREAMEILSASHISGLPVVDGEEVIGVFSSSDLLGFLPELDSPASSISFPRHWNPFEEVTVADLMTRKVHSLGPDCPVETAADFMRGLQIHRVVVMEDGRLLGIVTTTDIAKAFAEHLFRQQGLLRRSSYAAVT